MAEGPPPPWRSSEVRSVSEVTGGGALGSPLFPAEFSEQASLLLSLCGLAVILLAGRPCWLAVVLPEGRPRFSPSPSCQPHSVYTETCRRRVYLWNLNRDLSFFSIRDGTQILPQAENVLGV